LRYVDVNDAFNQQRMNLNFDQVKLSTANDPGLESSWTEV